MATALLSIPTESQAIFHWFRSGCCAPAAAPTYAYYGGCDTCCTPQVCQYVPQTCYRVQYCRVPVTTYRPVTTYQRVTSCDPCTGCPVTCCKPVTCLRPVTCYVTQARQVPYTTYRVVYSNPCAVGVAASSYGGGSSCSSCSPSTTYAAPAYAAPAYAAPAYTAPATPVPTTGVPSTSTPVPSLVPTPGTSSAPRTFQNDANGSNATETETETRMRPIPDANTNGGASDGPKLDATSAPRLIDPKDRTAAAWPAPAAWSYSRVAWPVQTEIRTVSAVTVQPVARAPVAPATEPRQVVDTDGWRPSNR